MTSGRAENWAAFLPLSREVRNCRDEASGRGQSAPEQVRDINSMMGDEGWGGSVGGVSYFINSVFVHILASLKSEGALLWITCRSLFDGVVFFLSDP